MKTLATILIVLFVASIKTNAQIPNGGFEIWESYEDNGEGCTAPFNVYEKPNLWVGSLPNSCQTHSFSLSKNNETYPAGTGQYSLRIQPDLANGVSGVAISNDIAEGAMNGWIPKPSFAINKRPASLYLYYKCFPFGGDTIIGLIYFYKNGVVIGNPSFGTNETISNWKAVEVPMTYYNLEVPDSATILFTTGAYLRHSESVMYVDNLSFDGFITSIPEQAIKNTEFSFYPNPASDIITLTIENRNNADLTMNMYNETGMLVKSQMLKQNQRQINVGDLSNGEYMVEIKSKDWAEKQKLIIQK
jgi:hypothetical protein